MAQMGRRRRRLSMAQRLAIVQDVATRLADGHGVPAVLEAIRSCVEAELDAAALVLSVVSTDGAGLATLYASGTSEQTLKLLQNVVPLGQGGPAKAVLSSGEPVYWSTLAQRDHEFPEYAGYASSCHAWAILPMAVHGTRFGVLSVGWEQSRKFSSDDSALLAVIANQCAIAVDRARLEDVEHSERETLELMSEGTRVMVSELDPASVVRKLVLLAVPRLAPWCAVYVADQSSLRRVAIEIAGHAGLAEELRGLQSVDIGSSAPLATCYRTGCAQVVSHVTEDHIRAVYDEAQSNLILAQDADWTALVIPIKAGGQVIGVMSLVSDDWGGAPPEGVWHSAEGLAGHAGAALLNARRYDVEHATASLLTQALLPSELTPIPGYDIASRYIPAQGGVAGDWFDVAPLPDGRFLLGIGDVGGHGIAAASLMAQLRNAARGLAVGGGGPRHIIHGLAELTFMDEAHGFATALYGLLYPADGAFRWSSAGHIPPLVFDDGSAHWLSFAEHPPFGVPLPGDEPEWCHQVNPAAGVVFLTDGVVERRGANIADGLEDLRIFVAESGFEDVQALAGSIAHEFCATPHDDCCIVVVRRHPTGLSGPG
ncbi:MAG TPA: SpoIIE family protein phosphatase [Acidimicrobiales bacterium]|nr:SpoIIE family protein phosphatase [Acidimicrobiales bacterium]